MDTGIFNALLKQILANQASYFLLLFLVAVTFLCQRAPKFPNWTIPFIIMPCGAALYPLLVSTSTVDHSYPYPLVVLILTGFIVGMIAVISGMPIIAWLLKRFGSNPPTTPPTDPPAPPNP